jgi:plastocyanin
MSRRTDLACLVLAGLGLVLGAPLIRAAAANVVTVVQNHRAFSIPAAAIKRGDSLHFTNEDVFNHQIYVKSAAFNFESAEQPPGETVSIVFTTAGTFDVQCEIHPRMHLAVTVN